MCNGGPLQKLKISTDDNDEIEWAMVNTPDLRGRFILGAGSNYTSGTLATSWESYTAANQAVGQVNLADSTSNNFWITGIQLEVGSSSSDFEFVPYDVNLQRCQRYYQDSFSSDNSEYSSGTGSATNGAIIVGERYPTPMRATPTLTFISQGVTTGDWSSSADNSDTAAVTVNSSGRNGFHQLICSGLTTGQPYYGRYKADAEL